MDKISFYDEGIYLVNQDSVALSEIDKNRTCFKSDVTKNLSKNEDIIRYYREYIDYASNFIKDMYHDDNFMITTLLIKILIDIGAFSDNNKFHYSSKKGNDIDGLYGLNVIMGSGCCRHVAYFHNDIYKNIGLDDIIFYCNFQDYDNDNAYHMPANHVINLIKYNNNLYGYDISNHRLFSFINKSKMKELYVDNPSYLYYKPYVDMVVNSLSLENVKDIINIFDTLKAHNIISREEYIEMCNTAKRIAFANKSMIHDFMNESKKYTKKIVRK